MKQFYYLYRTTNLINGKIYIGIHGTNDLSDGYVGSGSRIKSAIKKYGIVNFNKEILFIGNSYEEILNKERELVTEEFITKVDVYNLVPGGEYPLARAPLELRRAWGLKCKELKKGWFSPESQRKAIATKRSPGYKQPPSSTLHMQTPEVAEKRRQSCKGRVGEKVSTYGTMLITNGEITRRIRAQEKIPEGWRRGAVFPSRQNKIYITDGIKTKTISKDDPIPEGWRLGRTQKRKSARA